MAVNSATSFVLSSILTLLIFSGMQMYKPVLIRSPVTIIFGGYLGSLMFLFFVTATLLACVAVTTVFCVLLAQTQNTLPQYCQRQLGGPFGCIIYSSEEAIGNLEATLFGKNFQLKLPEIVLSMTISLIAAGMVHRICFTTCLIFSITTIYYMNKLSQKAYATAAPVAATAKSRRHK